MSMKPLREMVVFVAGLGQIGGSLAVDLVRKKLVKRVLGFDCGRSVMQQAQDENIIDTAVPSLEAGVNQADLTVLAMPIRTIIDALPDIVRWTENNRDKAVLDVAGTKSEIFRVLSEAKASINYIGGHPIAGSEKSGLDAAEPERFASRTFVLTPYRHTQPEWINTVKDLLSQLGTKTLLMDPANHDRLIAYSSHLPYLLAVALMELARKKSEHDERLWKLVGGSFRSATRVAASPTHLTVDMLLTNRGHLLEAVDALRAELSRLSSILSGNDEQSLRKLVESAHKTVHQLQNDKM
jgi:prephenate dehydrogenase